MIITIDTTKDSHDDIKKLISFLQNHIGEPIYENKTLNNDIPTPTEGMFGMFNNDPKPVQGNIINDAASFLRDDTQEEEIKEEKIDILPY